MKLREYNYELPKELIAQFPLKQRGQSRLLVINRKTGEIKHNRFVDIIEFFKPQDILVLNNTRVFKARIKGKKESGGRVEMLLVREINDGIWEALVHSSKRLKIGGKIRLANYGQALIVDKTPGKCLVKFNVPARDIIKKNGIVPLPHYIKRDTVPEDESNYQTVYADPEGSIAAPTAGLHFTPEILKSIQDKGVQIVQLTLHIGPGTFKPIRVQHIEKHLMDSEHAVIIGETARMIKDATRVIGVGTSVTRALESAPAATEFAGFTDLFIYPGYKFRVIDHLITNFHLPCSTPLLLVCAFAGKELIFKAYQEAIELKYRFLSYGDAMLII